MRAWPLALLVLLPLLPTAAAATPTCESVTLAGPTPAGPYLVRVTGHSHIYDVWAETNFLDGLQRVECLGSDGQLVAPDRYVGRFGPDMGGQPVCLPRVGCIW